MYVRVHIYVRVFRKASAYLHDQAKAINHDRTVNMDIRQSVSLPIPMSVDQLTQLYLCLMDPEPVPVAVAVHVIRRAPISANERVVGSIPRRGM